MKRKEKFPIPEMNPNLPYKAKASYYERYSTEELLAAGHLEEVGVRGFPAKTETLSVRVDKALLLRLKRTAQKKQLPLRTLIRMWLIAHVQEEKAA